MYKKILNIIKGANFISLLGNGISAVFNLFSFMVIARIFSKEDMGKWLLFLTAVGFFDMFRAGIVRSALVKFSARDTKNESIASSWVISIVISIFIALLLLLINILFEKQITQNHFDVFFTWYPLLVFCNLPFFISTWYMQAKYKFLPILLLRLCMVLPYLSISVYGYYKGLDIDVLVRAYVIWNILASLVALLMGWSGIKHIFKTNKTIIKRQLNFGKYSLGTVVGTNLLKSSDTFIINSMMGSVFVAFYNIPYRIVELIEVPVRSFGATLFPKMAKNSSDRDNVSRIFNLYVGSVTLTLIPVYIICFIFSDELVLILGGEKYLPYASLFKIFVIYALLLPLDRYIGIALDSLNCPKYNMIKIFLMVIFNVIGDIVVINYFNSIYAVAMITIGTVLVGVLFGMYRLKKEIKTSVILMLYAGLRFVKHKI